MWWRGLAGQGHVVGVDNSAAALGVHDVLDANGDMRVNDLFHGERVDDLGTIVRELSGFLGRNDRKQSRRRHLARVRSEDTVNLFPDLQLLGLHGHGCQRRAQIRVAPANVLEQTAGDTAKESRDDGHKALACLNLAFNLGHQEFVKVLVNAGLIG